MNKEIRELELDTFKNRKTGEIVLQIMGIGYVDGSWKHTIYNKKRWQLIKSEKKSFKKLKNKIIKGCGKSWDDPSRFGSFITKCFEDNYCLNCKALIIYLDELGSQNINKTQVKK